MANNVVSKNLYELLGNDHDEDSDKEPEPPVKVIDKTPARTTKRNAPAEAPASSAPATSSGNARRGGRGGFGGNDGAFRDRNAGRANNQGKPTDENTNPDRAPRAEGTYGGRGRGGRGRGNFDRHSRGVGGESEKQANHGWGAPEGGAELADEQAGEAIAKADETEALTGDAEGGPEIVEAPAAEVEPEDTSISYAEYLSQLAEKKLALGTLEIRKPDEGKLDKKWANAKPLSKEEEEDFVAAAAGKSKRERERTAKKIAVEFDQRFVEPTETRGGRGGGFRGGRGRGDGQSRGRGDGQSRGGRGEGRGDRRPRGDGSFRAGRSGGGQGQGGPRNNAATSLNTEDTNAFPSLGA